MLQNILGLFLHFKTRKLINTSYTLKKVAENLNWPKEHWTLFLQSVLIGKAREIYTQLGVEQSHHYETVEELILKGYELVPEAYRQKFRNCKKDSNQCYVHTQFYLALYMCVFFFGFPCDYF